MNKIAISSGASLGPQNSASEMETHQQKGHKTWSALETHQEKSSEVIIPVLKHAKLTFGSRFCAQNYD